MFLGGGGGGYPHVRNSFFDKNFVRKGAVGYPPYGQNLHSSIKLTPSISGDVQKWSDM